MEIILFGLNPASVHREVRHSRSQLVKINQARIFRETIIMSKNDYTQRTLLLE